MNIIMGADIGVHQTFLSLFKWLFNGAENYISLMKSSLFLNVILPIYQHNPPYYPVTHSLFQNIILHTSLYNPP